MKKFLKFICLALVAFTVSYFFGNKLNIFNSIPDNVPVYNENGFLYSKLNENEKKSYNLIMNEIYSFPEEISVTYLSDSELDRVFEAVLYDNTDVFFLGDGCTLNTVGNNNYFKPEYIITEDEYRSKMQELEEKEDIIVAEAMKLGSDYEKEFYIHETVSYGCEYIDKTGGDYSSAYGCLVKGQSSCEGYAKAVKRLLDKCGIDNHFAMGEAEDENGEIGGHLWNIVKINSNYYHLDATWNDNEIEGEIQYNYFNITDDEISVTHKVDERFLGKCNSTEQNYFVKNDLFFTEYDEETKNIISQKLSDFADENHSYTAFKFDDKETYDEAYYDLFDNENIHRILVRTNMESEKYIITDEVNYIPDKEHFIINIVGYYE